MSKLTTQYTDYSWHKMFVQYLADDGADCNAYTKEYDEQATQEGGNGERLAFKKINDKITTYHTILKYLTGERRANISETIPAIDFATPTNSSMMSTYPYTSDDKSSVNPTIITEVGDRSESAINLIKAEDESIINRALAGYEMAEHFYNTTSTTGSDYNLQTSPFQGDSAIIYKSMTSEPIINSTTLEEVYTNRYDSIYIAEATSDSYYIVFNPDSTEFQESGELLDSLGNIIPNTTTTTSNGSTFITASGTSSYQLSVATNDIIIILPTALGSSDVTRILIFKYNAEYASNIAAIDDIDGATVGDTVTTIDGEETTVQASYDFYILYVTGYASTLTFTEIAVEEELPNYFDNPIVLNKTADYMSVSQESYAEASGLLSGAFCEPYERESGTVTKWLFQDDTDTAEERGVTINVGSIYYPGHVLGRGNPIDQPFKLTNDTERNAVDANGNPYKGKATYIYDKLEAAGDQLLKSVQSSDWYGSFLLNRLDYVVKKSDYTGETLTSTQYLDLTGQTGSGTLATTVAYPGKFFVEDTENATITISDGNVSYNSTRAVEATDIKEYIDICLDHVSSDGKTLIFDFSSDSNALYYKEDYCGKDFKQSFGYSTGSSTITTSFDKIFWVTWRSELKNKSSSYKTIMSNVSIQMVSPINAFAPKGTTSTIYNASSIRSIIQGLLSTSSSTVSLKTYLLYPEYEKYLPQELYLFSNYDLGLEEYVLLDKDDDGNIIGEGNRGMCSFYNPEEGKIICFKVESVRKFLPSQCTQAKIYCPVTQTWQTKSISISSDNDCYIYVLAPMELSMSGISIWGQDDELIELSEDIQDVMIIPMSYPNDYFPVTQEEQTDGTTKFLVKASHRSTDIETLKNSYIIPGLPIYDDADEFLSIKLSPASYLPSTDPAYNGLLMTHYAYMLAEDSDGVGSAISSMLRKGLQFAINDFKMSDGETNPILFSDLGDVLEGLIELYPNLYDLAKAEFTVEDPTEEDETITITADDLEGLRRRIINDDDYADYIFDVSLDTESSDWTYVNYGTDNEFAANVANRLSNCLIMSPTSAETEEKYRPSLTRLKEFYTSVMEDSDFTREECELIDEYFGNDTVAFIRFGSSRASTGTPSSISDASTLLTSYATQIIQSTYEDYVRDELYDVKVAAYSEYFTAETAAQYAAGTISTSGLLLDFDNSEKVISMLQSVKSNIKTLSSLGNILTRYNAYYRYYKWSFSTWKTTLCLTNALRNTTPSNSTDSYWKTIIVNYVKNQALSNASSAYNNSDTVKAFGAAELTEEMIGNWSGQEWKEVDGETVENLYTVERVATAEELAEWNANNPDNQKTEGYIYVATLRLFNPVTENGETTLVAATDDNGEDLYVELKSPVYTFASSDIYPRILYGIRDYISTALEGTGDSSYYVKYVTGDNAVSGRENSLYYKRYQMLNNRMNRAQGNLYRAANVLNNRSLIQDIEDFGINYEESFADYMTVTPVVSMDQLSYFPTQEATATTIPMDGKFYYQEELETIRELINSRCVLTCNYCEVKDSCPFYNEEEILKLYVPEATTINLFLKDNELELLYYDGDEPVYLTSEDVDGEGSESIDISSSQYLPKIHKPYSDILKKVTTTDDVTDYDINDLESLRNTLQNYYEDYENETRGGLGWLINGRYGTVQANNLISINTDESTMTNDELDESDLPSYKTLFDAVFIPDEETEIVYAPSTSSYDVTLVKGPYNDKKIYKGSVRLKIPATLKCLLEANPDDDVYLVSDDTQDATGESITPVIYLNTVANLEYVFDLMEIDGEATESGNTILYPKDVAQWCVNYLKTTCIEDPIGSHTDLNADKDQFWMEEIKKEVINESGVSTYITLPGRTRVATGYQEPVMDYNNLDTGMIVSGKPVAATYYNFTRKFMINLQNVQWLKPNTTLYPEFNEYDAEEAWLKKVEAHKSILPLMQTNLRLVIVKNPVGLTEEDDDTEETLDE